MEIHYCWLELVLDRNCRTTYTDNADPAWLTCICFKTSRFHSSGLVRCCSCVYYITGMLFYSKKQILFKSLSSLYNESRWGSTITEHVILTECIYHYNVLYLIRGHIVHIERTSIRLPIIAYYAVHHNFTGHFSSHLTIELVGAIIDGMSQNLFHLFLLLKILCFCCCKHFATTHNLLII